MKRTAPVAIVFLLATLAVSTQCRGQQAGTPVDLQKQVDALKAQVGAMQKDLDDIKALLAPLKAALQPAAPKDLTLELGTRAVKGDASAKLVLVEFTDYQ
ncbi:MAG: hypothetical protein ACM3NQ_18510 [Bacteroidales bacterium]